MDDTVTLAKFKRLLFQFEGVATFDDTPGGLFVEIRGEPEFKIKSIKVDEEGDVILKVFKYGLPMGLTLENFVEEIDLIRETFSDTIYEDCKAYKGVKTERNVYISFNQDRYYYVLDIIKGKFDYIIIKAE